MEGRGTDTVCPPEGGAPPDMQQAQSFKGVVNCRPASLGILQHCAGWVRPAAIQARRTWHVLACPTLGMEQGISSAQSTTLRLELKKQVLKLRVCNRNTSCVLWAQRGTRDTCCELQRHAQIPTKVLSASSPPNIQRVRCFLC